MPNISKISNNIPNKIPAINKLAKVLSKLQNSSATLPVALIETTVIAGRSYQGYKRGGKDELRERLIEETTSAGFWLFGIIGLNKLGNCIGKKWLGLKNLAVGTGNDALRDPSLLLDKKTKNFKLLNILLSTGLAVSFVGFFLPKINQKITKNVVKKDQEKRLKTMPVIKMDNFMQAQKPIGQTSFKGAPSMDFIAQACHNLENENIWRLITTDVGITGGRVANSRNKYEAREYLFRDVAASYFYMFATAHIMNGLFGITNTPKVNPEAVLKLQKHLLDKVGEQKFSPKEFEIQTLGKRATQDVIEKIACEFDKNDVVKLNALKNVLNKAQFEKAQLMSLLQPKNNGERLLSKAQVEDVLSDNWLSDPKFLYKFINKSTYGLSNKRTKFVSQNVCEQARASADKFTKALIEFAGDKEIDADLIQKFTKRNIKLNAVFTVAGFAVSIFGLSFLIPKAQQYMTYKATGKNAFPGTQNYA